MKAAVIHTVSRTEQTILLFEHIFSKKPLVSGIGDVLPSLRGRVTREREKQALGLVRVSNI